MEIGEIISTYGFPIFVALWFMFRLEKKLDGLTNAIIELREAIDGKKKT